MIWSVAGAALQFAGGAKKALGVLFATGLLIKNPIYGIGLLPVFLLPIAYAVTFDRVTLSDADLASFRGRLAAIRQAHGERSMGHDTEPHE